MAATQPLNLLVKEEQPTGPRQRRHTVRGGMSLAEATTTAVDRPPKKATRTGEALRLEASMCLVNLPTILPRETTLQEATHQDATLPAITVREATASKDIKLPDLPSTPAITDLATALMEGEAIINTTERHS